MKKSNTTVIILFISLFFSLSSCTRLYYTPLSHNIPNLEEKGDIYVAAVSADIGNEFHSAIAVNEHLGITASYANYYDSEHSEGFSGSYFSTPSSFNEGGGKIIELGGGYFDTLKHNFSYAIYGTYGFGDMYNRFEHLGDIRADLSTISIQPNLTYRRKNWEFTYAMKYTNLGYSNPSGDLTYDIDEQGNTLYEAKELEKQPNIDLFQQSITIRTGGKKLKAHVQASFGNGLNNSWLNDRISTGTVSIGASYKFNLKNISNK